MKATVKSADKRKLLKWFEREKRTLPWRKTKNAYAIWISEVMLQQTTAKAVIPYYKKFLKVFPDVKSLSQATEKTIYPLWTGLGYYQRAKNLIKAAKEIEKQGRFPSSYRELIRLPGFGPYTARAVSSLAFEESVGIVDGNVIRFLSRFHGLTIKWWTAQERKHLQSLADSWTVNQKPSRINQALMEMGSLICSSPTPLCLLCPLKSSCVAFKNQSQNQLPLKRPKKTEEMFHWQPLVIKRKELFAFIPNRNLPFLKGRPVFPGKFTKIKTQPHRSHFKHTITHHKIYVTVQSANSHKIKEISPLYKEGKIKKQRKEQLIWLDPEAIMERNPSSLIQKILSISTTKTE